jgi:hypothetical protein
LITAALALLASQSNAGFDIPFSSDEAVSRAIFNVEMPISEELIRSGMSEKQVALARELGIALFTEDYCGVRVMTRGDRMVVDATATAIGLSRDALEEAARRFDARLTWHFREDVLDRGIPLTFCRQAREMQVPLGKDL